MVGVLIFIVGVLKFISDLYDEMVNKITAWV